MQLVEFNVNNASCNSPSKLSLINESLEDISHSHALDQNPFQLLHFIHRLEKTNVLVDLWQQVDNSFVEIQ
jgi:hypothetical protein